LPFLGTIAIPALAVLTPTAQQPLSIGEVLRSAGRKFVLEQVLFRQEENDEAT
jgi:hypothetical protein